MSSLASKKCVPCEGDMLPLTAAEAGRFLQQIDQDWKIVDGKKLRRQFVLKSFADAMKFVNRVAAIAEQEDHHPDITINYKKVTIELTTHAIGGLSENDFILGAKIEKLV